MLYSYQKATPDHPSPGKVIPRHLKAIPVLISSIGLGLVASVAWPMASYNVTSFFNTKNQDLGLLSPIIYESLASESESNSNLPTVLSEVDYTKASNWFTFSPESAPAETSDESISEFINLNPKEKSPKDELTVRETEYQLAIPSLGIKEATVKTDSEDLAKSLIQYRQTALPGQLGAPIIFGHSTLPQFFNPGNYLTIFSTLPKIKIGSDVFVTYAGVKYTYRISKMFEVKPNEIWVLRQDYSKKTLRLITCVPPGTKLRRLVVEADLIPT